MELFPIEEALRAVVALFFAYVALVGGVGAIKFIALDLEVRQSAKQQTLFINELSNLFTQKFEEKKLKREKRLVDRMALLKGTQPNT